MKIGRMIAMCAVAVMLCGADMVYGAEKIGYVNIGRVFNEYTKTQEYEEVFSKKYDAYQGERNEKLTKLQEKQGKLALLREAEKKKLEEEIERDKAAIMDYDRQKEIDMRREHDEKTREILLEVEKTVREFAEREKYSLILNDRVLIYGDTGLDITDQIIKKLNSGFSAAGK